MLGRIVGPAARRMVTTAGQREASTLVVAVHDNKFLNPATLSAVTAASKIGGEVRPVPVSPSMLHALPSVPLAVLDVRHFGLRLLVQNEIVFFRLPEE